MGNFHRRHFLAPHTIVSKVQLRKFNCFELPGSSKLSLFVPLLSCRFFCLSYFFLSFVFFSFVFRSFFFLSVVCVYSVQCTVYVSFVCTVCVCLSCVRRVSVFVVSFVCPSCVSVSVVLVCPSCPSCVLRVLVCPSC